MAATRTTRARRLAAAAAAGLLLAACATPDGEFLADVGPGLSWVRDAEVVSAAASTTTTVPDLVPIDGVTWTNDPLAIDAEGASAVEVTRRIYEASTKTDRFVQAAPADIATVLPGIDIPALVPSDVAHITSQLVFDPVGRRLSNDPAAAFGLWIVEPYSQSRSVGQRGVLFVSLDADADTQITNADEGCRRLEGRGSCDPVEADGWVGWWVVDSEGATLVWYEAPHRYELSVRADRDLAERMARSTAPLVTVLDR